MSETDPLAPTDRALATWFAPSLSPTDRAALFDLVGRVDAALRELGLDYVLYGGALLGQCIYRDLLPWDDDADLLVLGELPPEELCARLGRVLPGLCVVTHKGQLKVARPAPPGSPVPWAIPFVDIGFMYRQGDEWCHNSMWGGVDTFPAADITPTARAPLGGVEVSVPARSEAVCRRKYGPECLTSAVPPAFDHRAEHRTGFPRVRVPLDRIDRVLHNLSPLNPVLTQGAVGAQTCVVLVPSGAVFDRAFEDALAELNRRGYPVRRVRQSTAPPGFRDRMAAEALGAGFTELLWLDPAIAFDPADVERLRGHQLPFVCGVYPASGPRGLACTFPSGTTSVRFGTGGGLIRAVACGLGFALVRREVFEAVAKSSSPGTEPVYFRIPGTDGETVAPEAEDAAFCARARGAGFAPVTDTAIRLWRTGLTRLGWEDASGDRGRAEDFTVHILPAEPATGAPSKVPHTESGPEGLREPAAPLAPDGPRVRLYVVTYPTNAASLDATLASIRASDWGEEPVVITQPADWPVDRESGSRNFRRALEAADRDGCDFALILEDDVRVGRHLRHNVLTNPLVRRDQCDYLGLFVPDLIADPWDRSEPHLGYRLARPRYAGPNRLWERGRIWGSQGYVLSRRLVRAALDRWDRLREGQDSRIISVCSEFKLPLWYTAPCLVEHAPIRSAFGTPDAYAPDFDPEFRLDLGTGFQPPDGVPGHLTRPEAELLWRSGTGRTVLELGTGRGRGTVCLSQSANRVVSVGEADPSEAAEWVRRFGHADRVEFRTGDMGEVCAGMKGAFDLIWIAAQPDAANLERSITAALPPLAPGELLAFHDYPDPRSPDVRRVVDGHARRLGWTRVAQADFLGVFRT